MSCPFCAYPDYQAGFFCDICAGKWTAADLPDDERALQGYSQYLRDTLFDPQHPALRPLLPGDLEIDPRKDPVHAIRARLKVSFAAAQRIHADLIKLRDRVKPLIEFKLAFDANLNEAYANSDTKLRFQLTNTSAGLPITKATLFWDDPDWEDDRDFMATSQLSVSPGRQAVISGNHVFKRGGDKSISTMFMKVDRLSESVLLRLHTIDFFVGNPNVSVQNIIHNTSTTQVSVEGTGAIFKAGEIGTTNTRTTEEPSREPRWVEVAFSFVHDEEFSDRKVERAARDMGYPIPQRGNGSASRESAQVPEGLVASGVGVSPLAAGHVPSPGGPDPSEAGASSGSRLRCQGCGSSLRPGARTCLGCGTPVPAGLAAADSSPAAVRPKAAKLYCNHCGTECAPNARFCTGCGAVIAAASAPSGVGAPAPVAAAMPASAPVAAAAPAAAPTPAEPAVAAGPHPAARAQPEAVEADELPPIETLDTVAEAVQALLELCRRLGADRTISMNACMLELGQALYRGVPDLDLGDLIGLLVHNTKSVERDAHDSSLVAGFSGEATVLTLTGLTAMQVGSAPVRSKPWRDLGGLSFSPREFGRGRFVVSLAEGPYTWPGGLFDLRLRPVDNLEAMCAYGNLVIEILRSLDKRNASDVEEDYEEDEEESDAPDEEINEDEEDEVDVGPQEDSAGERSVQVTDPATEARWGVLRRFFSVFSFAMQRCSEKQARAIYCGEHVSDELLFRLWSAARMSGSGMVVVCIDPAAGEFSIEGKLVGWRGQASVLSLEGVYHMARSEQGEYRLDGFHAFLSWTKFFEDIQADLFIRDAAADIWLGTSEKFFILGCYCEYASNVLQWDYFEEFVKPELLSSFDDFKSTVLES